MNSRVTKKRFLNNLSYDWLKIVIFIVILVLLLELLLGTVKQKLNDGQKVNIFYLYTVDSAGAEKSKTLIENEDVFSFDVLSYNVSQIIETNAAKNIYTKIATYELDMIVCDNHLVYESEEAKEEADADKKAYSSFKDLIDGFRFYDYDTLGAKAKEYVASLCIDNDFENDFDQAKVEKNFRKRMKGDNRFRKEKDIKKGLEQERERLIKLKEDVAFFNEILNNPLYSDLFITYTKYEYRHYNGEETKYEQETPKRYGFNPAFLTGGSEPVSNYFRSYDTGTAEDVVILTFNYSETFALDLQFEVISYLNAIIKTCGAF